jgi:hypothetical protein
MSDDVDPEALTAVYAQVCESYRAIDDVRMKLLGLLPLATGAGIVALASRDTSGEGWGLSQAVGLFGLVATLGLFSYELHGMKKCGALIDTGKLIERRLRVYGQFLRRPQEVAGFVDEPFAASVIYPASLAGWTFFAVLGVPARWIAYATSACVFVAAFVMSTWLIRAIEADARERARYHKEPCWLRSFEPNRDPLPDDAYVSPSTAVLE